MVQLIPCPEQYLEKLRQAFEKKAVQHFVLWDTTFHLNEEGSCQVMDCFKYRNLRKCDGYNPDRYKSIASIGDPPR